MIPFRRIVTAPAAGALLSSINAAFAQDPEPRYTLTLVGPAQEDVRNDDPNRGVCFLAHDSLPGEGDARGARAWTLSNASYEYGGIADSDTAGTAAKEASFQLVEHIDVEASTGDCARSMFGVVSSVVLSEDSSISLPENETHPVLTLDVLFDRVFLAGEGGGAKVIPYVHVGFVGGCSGSEQTFANTVTDADGVHTPTSRSLDIAGNFDGPNHAPFIRGDAHQDGGGDISDAIWILGELFLGFTPLGCPDALDTNGSFAVDVSDAVFLVAHLFLGGPDPLRPCPDCDFDPINGFDCQLYGPCP